MSADGGQSTQTLNVTSKEDDVAARKDTNSFPTVGFERPGKFQKRAEMTFDEKSCAFVTGAATGNERDLTRN
jgi:hypothetical protein